MKCKDCLKEIDEKEYFNRSVEGVCKKCRARMSQIKYENKKFGTNRKYVPLRLKEDGRTKEARATKKEKVLKKNNNTNTAKTMNKIYDERIEKMVLDDIRQTFQENNITINPQDIPPFNVFMDMFCSLIDINNGYMVQYKKAEEIFNQMEGDYQHSYENAGTPELFLERSQMFRCLLDQRRNIKNGIGQYDKIVEMLQDIVKKNPKILEIAKSSRDDLHKTIESQEGHYYKAKASNLIAKEDFCIGKRNWGKWHVTIPLMNYYGNKAPVNFERDVWADGENGAILNVKEYLKQKFPSCPYNETKFKVEKISDETAVCL